ncbi:MAG: alpha-(1-_3)-arabinofuranosyltransferase family protein [Thermoproteota archaeon]
MLSLLKSKTVVNTKVVAIIILAIISFEPFFLVGDKVVLHPFIEQQNYTADHFLSTWSDINGGLFGAPALPMQLVGPSVVSIFGQSLSWVILSGTMAFIAALGMFYLTRLITKSIPIRIIGALAYTLSIAGIFFSFSSIGFSPPWAFFPFFLYLFWTAKQGTIYRNAFFIALISIFMAGSNQTIVALYFFTGALILIYKFIFVTRREFYDAVKFAIIAVPLSFVLTAYYYIPEYILFSSSRDYFDVILSAEGPGWLNSASDYFETFRMMGNVDMTYNWAGFSHPEWQLFYDSELFVLLSFVFPIAAIAGLLFVKGNKFGGFSALLLLLALPFAVGGYPSFTGAIYLWLYSHIPLFSIFRDSYKLMIPVSIGYAILFTALISHFYNSHKSNRPSRKVVPLASISLASILLLTIAIQPLTGTQTDRSSLIDIPQYWRDLGEWTRGQEGDFRVLMLPNAGVPSYKFTSHPGMHPEFFHALMLNHDISIVSPTSPNRQTIEYTYNALCGSTDNFSSLSRILNLKYLLLQKDTQWDIYGFQSPDDAKKCIAAEIGKSSPDMTFGNLEVYYLPESYQAPKIYGVYSVSEAYTKDFNLYFEGDGQKIEYADYSENSGPEIQYVKENLWKYKVKVKTDRPFTLVFSESFHPEWKAIYGNAEWINVQFLESAGGHREINTYSNGWYIPKTGEYEITLMFMPQASFYASLIVSIVGFIAAVYWLTFRNIVPIPFLKQKVQARRHSV